MKVNTRIGNREREDTNGKARMKSHEREDTNAKSRTGRHERESTNADTRHLDRMSKRLKCVHKSGNESKRLKCIHTYPVDEWNRRYASPPVGRSSRGGDITGGAPPRYPPRGEDAALQSFHARHECVTPSRFSAQSPCGMPSPTVRTGALHVTLRYT